MLKVWFIIAILVSGFRRKYLRDTLRNLMGHPIPEGGGHLPAGQALLAPQLLHHPHTCHLPLLTPRHVPQA